VHSADHQELALQAARESIVLLKNDRDLLPLSKTLRSIAVIGPNADAPRHQLGDYISEVVTQPIVTVLQGIKQVVSADTRVTFVQGCNIEGAARDEIAAAKAAAAAADVAIVVVGENHRGGLEKGGTNGEGRDAATLELTGLQEELVKAVHAAGKPTVVVLINGRPLATRWIAQHVPALVEAWIPGERGGQAVAEVLFGDVNPSGKLTVTVPRHAGQLPVYYNTKKSKRHWLTSAKERAYVDLEATPLFPFGFGLSYTQFEYRDLQLTKTEISPSEGIEVRFAVKNTGRRAGAEVAQLYIEDVVGSVATPAMELRGFEKIELAPGETKTCTLRLRPDDLALFDANLKRVVEPGQFRVMVGASAADIRLNGEFRVK
jgi:beta-glucosidase